MDWTKGNVRNLILLVNVISYIVMMELVFATGNKNKTVEIARMLGNRFKLMGLGEIGCFEEIPETTGTIEGNAIQKARYVYEKYGYDCFAEDTGLEIYALDMAPGVHTARYAGEEKNPNANMAKVLEELKGEMDRKARFKTVIAYVRSGNVLTFEGIADGNIALEKQGMEGFGYDPIFIPQNENRSFAEMTMAEKNQISHRAKSFRKFLEYLDKEKE